MAMSVIFDSSPILSHRISSGTHASDGTARIAPSVGPEEHGPTSAKSPVDGAEEQPSDAPMANPISTRWAEITMKPRACRARRARWQRRRPSGRRQLDDREPPERGRRLPEHEDRERQAGADDDPAPAPRGDGATGRRTRCRSRSPARRGPSRRHDRPGPCHSKRLGFAFVTNVSLMIVREGRVDRRPGS